MSQKANEQCQDCQYLESRLKAVKEKDFEAKLNTRKAEIAESFNTKQNEDPNKVIQVIDKDFKANKDAVIKMLIGNVLNVNVEVPRVVKGNFDDDE